VNERKKQKAFYLSLSSAFNTTHLRAFQLALYFLLVFFCADHRNRHPIFYSQQDFQRPITTPLSLTVVLPEP